VKLQLGVRLTAGLGAGANPDVAGVQLWKIRTRSLRRSRVPTWCSSLPVSAAAPAPGAAPVIASLASEMGILTVAVVTRPFAFEGKRRLQQAERGMAELRSRSIP